jgi:alkylation response protein AidB-like acyl-CoA dehydrogenase
MDFEFPEDTLMLRDMLRRFVQKEARPLEMDYFNTGALKPEQRDRLRRSIEQLGLWGYLAPEELGGMGLDMVTSCMIEEELGGTFVPLEMGNVPPMLYACRDDQVGKYLEPALDGSRKSIIAAREPGQAGVNPETWRTVAALSGDKYHIEGQKVLSIQPDPDDFFIVLALQEPETLPEDGTSGQTAFLLEPDTPGLSIQNKNIQITDGRTQSVIVLSLQDCQAGQENILGEPGEALKLASGEAPRAIIRMGARYVGMVERLIEMASEHARDWVSLGASLAVRPAIQRMLAEMRVEVESVRWLVYHAAWLIDAKGDDMLRVLAAQVRLASGVMLKHAVDNATMVYTGPGPSPQIDPQRFVQSAVPMDALELGLEQARIVVANQMLSLSQI